MEDKGTTMASNTPIRSNSTPFSNSILKSKSVFLHEWWLVKPLNHSKGFALSGITSMGKGERVFVSTLIVKRYETNVVETQDGIIVGFSGFINFSRSFHNGFSSQICQRFSIGFPHDWKKLAALLEDECDYVDRVNDFDVSNTPCHKETTDDTSQEAIELEGNKNSTTLKLSQPQGDTDDTSQEAIELEGNKNSATLKLSQPQGDTDDTSQETIELEGNKNSATLKLSQPQGDTDDTLQEAIELEGNKNSVTLKLSQPQGDVINDENGYAYVDDSNASPCQKTADKCLQEAEGDDDIASPKLSHPQVDVFYIDENGYAYVDDSNASPCQKTADKCLQEAEVNEDIASPKLSHQQVDVFYIDENGCAYVDVSNASPCQKTADKCLQEADGDDDIVSHKLSHPQVEVAYNGEGKVSDFDDLNASSFPKKTADVTSHEAKEAEDDDNVGGCLRMSQPQVDVINTGENGVSSVAAAESNQSKIGVLEFDPILEQSSVKSPLHPKKLKLSSDSKKNKKHLKRKMVEDPENSCRRVTRSIAKKCHIML